MSNRTNEDISNLSYRMTKQLELAMNDLENVKKNIKEINTIIEKTPENVIERKIEEREEKNNLDYHNEEKNQELPRAGVIGIHRNMSHNRWISSLRSPFSHYFL
jgi:hypothetical protein